MPKVLTAEQIVCFRNRLCDLALVSFAKHGVDGISLRGMAAELGCSRTTPYRYFKNKADILAALRQREFGRLADTMENTMQQSKHSGQQLMALASSYLHFAMANPAAYRVMYEVEQQDAHHYPQLSAEILRSAEPLRQLINTLVASGQVHGDPLNISYLYWAGLHGLISLHLSNFPGQERDIEELASVMIHSLTLAVSTPPALNPVAGRSTGIKITAPG